ncbi:hypothetical protein OGAPHI_003016 [Ogataea philodendri]|uniref:Uncharacterized protein n=1 Tax=Ogataea philodendri TaxID=1378263 RepID=A0A9P8P8M0_9ASCO|nr:uncharacterized protein OGAPHI_003016 [Ogataea philodendri]KAH3667367.1 hypothetical protein OGAPHI_003016 [Ogataea philodendri]
MSPLDPSSSKCYRVDLPDTEDEEASHRLDVRSGSSSAILRSRIILYGGSVLPLPLDAGFKRQELQAQFELAVQEHAKCGKIHQDYNKYLSTELFSLSLLDRKWVRRKPIPSSEKPLARMFHSMVVHDNYIYIFGGLRFDANNQLKLLNDFWRYDKFEKVWKCLLPPDNDILLKRYDHMTEFVPELYVIKEPSHHGFVIFGGLDEDDKLIKVSQIYDLVSEKLHPRLIFKMRFADDSENIGHHAIEASKDDEIDVPTLGIRATTNSMVSAQSLDSSQTIPAVYIYKSQPDEKVEPFVTFFLDKPDTGITEKVPPKNISKMIPFELTFPTLGYFGENLIVTGFRPAEKTISLYIFNRVSRTWTKLQVSCTHSPDTHRFFKGFVWNSHHKVIFLGSAKHISDYPTVQHFDHFISVSLPFTNTYGIELEHAFKDEALHKSSSVSHSLSQPSSSSTQLKNETTSFAAYSHYVAPQVIANSIRSVFPPYAVALGKNAFERTGSFADFEFICDDGTSISVPLSLCRRRWGRTFDKLLTDAYARAFAERNLLQDRYPGTPHSTVNSETESIPSLRLQKGSDLRAPTFRYPFQDSGRTTPGPGTPTYGSVPASRRSSLNVPTTSRRDSVGPSRRESATSRQNSSFGFEKLAMTSKSSNMHRSSIASTSSSSSAFSAVPRASVPSCPATSSIDQADFNSLPNPIYVDDLPAQPPMPPERAQSQSETASKIETPPHLSSKSLPTSRLAYSVSNFEDVDPLSESNTSNLTSNLTSEDDVDFPDESKAEIDFRYLPRTLCLPYSRTTVRAFSEFLYTGQLGSNWKVIPTCAEVLMIAKLYDVPLLYDLISEVLFVVIARKEAKLVENAKEARSKLQVPGDGTGIAVIDQFTNYLATLDDNLLDVVLLKRASRAVGRYSRAGSLESSEVNLREPSTSRKRASSFTPSMTESLDSSNSGEDFTNETLGLLDQDFYAETKPEDDALDVKEWPTLKDLLRPDGKTCPDVIIDVLVEIGALASDIKLMLRAINCREMIMQLRDRKREPIDETELSEKLAEARLRPHMRTTKSSSSLPPDTVFKNRSESESFEQPPRKSSDQPRIPHSLTFTSLERSFTSTSAEAHSPRRKRGFGLFKKK